MQIVIDIPDFLYQIIQDCKVIEGNNEGNLENVLIKAVENGVALPKGHGRLVDADDIALIDEQFYTPSDYCVAERAINDAPTIIEADMEERTDT